MTKFIWMLKIYTTQNINCPIDKHKNAGKNISWSKAAKIPALTSSKIDKYEGILPFNQRQLIEQAKCVHSSLGKDFKIKKNHWRLRWKKTKDIEISDFSSKVNELK